MAAQNITSYDIHALVDNELEWEDEKRVRAYIRDNEEARKFYNELCRQRKLLQRWWAGTKGAFH